MNSVDPPFEKLEANLELLRARIPELPVSAVLISRLLLHLGRDVSTLLDIKIRPFGLTEVEFRVLTTLHAQPDGLAHPSELCARTSQSPANMSRISDALVGRDFISRVASLQDRRRMVLRTTPRGDDLVKHLLPVLYGPLRGLVEGFADDEQRQLIGQLKRIGARLDAAITVHPPGRSP